VAEEPGGAGLSGNYLNTGKKGERKMFEKKWGWIGVIGLAILLLVSPPTDAANRDFSKVNTVKIGILAPVQMPVGHGIINAAKLAADEINAAGGILGKKIELVIGDSESKPEKGVLAMKKLALDDKVDVLVGEYSSGVALAIQPFLSQYEIVFISTGCASADLHRNVRKDYEKNKYYFMNMPDSIQQEKEAARLCKEFVNGKLGYKKFAILAENAKWTEEFAPELKKDLENAGLEVVFYERFDVEMKDFAPTFAKIKSLNTQWIAQVLSHAASIPLVKAWSDSKPAPMGGVNVGSQDAKFWETTGGACASEISFNHIARAPLTTKTIAFWDKYEKTFANTPFYPSGYTYDSVNMLADVIKKKKSLKSKDIINGLENTTHSGVIHTAVGFDKKSHAILEGRYGLSFLQWQEGAKQVVIFPEKYKTGEYVKPAWWKK
jgi:branched-chain amino acid transport system substrate-binding protein